MTFDARRAARFCVSLLPRRLPAGQRGGHAHRRWLPPPPAVGQVCDGRLPAYATVTGRLWVVIAATASLLVLRSFAYFYGHGLTLAYGDGITKLNNARRVFDNPTGDISLAQVGSIWLPAQSALTALTVWISTGYYRTGIAGSIWSMLSFVAAVVLAYALVVSLTHSKLGGLAASVVMASNLNFLYLATTPMTEALLVASETLCTVTLVQYEKTLADRWLRRAALSLGFACLVRYEMWFITVCAVGIVGLALARKRVGWERWLCDMVVLSFVPAMVIGAWLIYQRAILGDFLYFAHSRYSARAIDVVGANKQFAVHNLPVAVSQYAAAVRWNFLSLALVGAAAGAALYLGRFAIGRERALTPLFLCGIPAFFIVSLYLGQNAIDIQRGTLNSLNIRYGTTILPLVALGNGYLIGSISQLRLRGRLRRHIGAIGPVTAALAITIFVAAAIQPARQPLQHTAVLYDVAAQPSQESSELAQWLSRMWHATVDDGRPTEPDVPRWLDENLTQARGAKLLTESFGPMNGVQLHTGIPLRYFITETTPALFDRALDDPAALVAWVITRDGDAIDQRLREDPEFRRRFRRDFRQVFENKLWRVYAQAG